MTNSELSCHPCQRALAKVDPVFNIHLSDLPSDLLQRVISELIVEPREIPSFWNGSLPLCYRIWAT